MTKLKAIKMKRENHNGKKTEIGMSALNKT